MFSAEEVRKIEECRAFIGLLRFADNQSEEISVGSTGHMLGQLSVRSWNSKVALETIDDLFSIIDRHIASPTP